MGTLRYDGQTIEFDDLTLMHLMIATTARLRRNEPFLLSWHEDSAGQTTRKAVWLSTAAILTWTIDGPDPVVDRQRIERMIMTAGSSAGLYVPANAPTIDAA